MAETAMLRNYKLFAKIFLPMFKIRESILIGAKAEEIWPFVAGPLLQKEWNTKIVSVERHRTGPVTYGERYSMMFQMGSTPLETDVEIIECDMYQNLTIEHHSVWKGKEQFVTVNFQLASSDNYVKVTQSIDFSRSRIPLIFRILMWIINRLGKPVGRTNLEELRRIVGKQVM
jgi:hypothetical protein